jgi:hypothetical protein
MPEVWVAEGEGFGRGKLPPVNGLRSVSSAQIAQNAQNLSIRYKTSTADQGRYPVCDTASAYLPGVCDSCAAVQRRGA